jgi:hypothetical protein
LLSSGIKTDPASAVRCRQQRPPSSARRWDSLRRAASCHTSGVTGSGRPGRRGSNRALAKSGFIDRAYILVCDVTRHAASRLCRQLRLRRTTPSLGLFEVAGIIGKNEELAARLFTLHRWVGLAGYLAGSHACQRGPLSPLHPLRRCSKANVAPWHGRILKVVGLAPSYPHRKIHDVEHGTIRRRLRFASPRTANTERLTPFSGGMGTTHSGGCPSFP